MNDMNECIIYMESNYEWKDINIKNRTCYNFEDIVEFEYFQELTFLKELMLMKRANQKIGTFFTIGIS